MADFKEVLYEALVYSFGKIFAKYDTFTRETMLKDFGKEIVDYLNRHGVRFEESGTAADMNRLLELFVDNGFVTVERRPAEKGEIVIWKKLYGIRAYTELHEVLENPFLSCPLNASRRYLADMYGKDVKSHSLRFNLADNTIEIHEEIVAKESVADSPLRESEVTSAHLYELAASRAQRLEKMLSERKKLQGLIPICAYCKKIRADKKSRNRIESSNQDLSKEFSHFICPDCYERAIEDYKLQ